MATYPDRAGALALLGPLRPQDFGSLAAAFPRLDRFFFPRGSTVRLKGWSSDGALMSRLPPDTDISDDGLWVPVEAYKAGGDLPDPVIACRYAQTWFGVGGPAPPAVPAIGTDIRANTGAIYTVTASTVAGAAEGVLTLTWKAWA